jgi:hypothetical protein
MSNEEVDELFGQGGGAPSPRTATIVSLLVGGLVIGLVGLACTSVPGGVMVLAGWMLVEKEMDRIDSGYLPSDARKTVGVLQMLAYAAVFGVIALFGLQAWLFCSGAYDQLWADMLEWYVTTFGPSPAGAPPNP